MRESREGRDDELTELQEAVEMATLDKEMAEERVSSFILFPLFLYFANSRALL